MAKSKIETMAKTIKSILDKEGKILIDRTGDYYYICGGGFWLAKIPEIHYEKYFFQLAPYFVAIDDGGGVVMNRLCGDKVPHDNGGNGLAQFIEQAAACRTAKDAHISPLVYDLGNRKIRILAYGDGTEIMGINEKYYAIVKNQVFPKITTGGRTCAVYFGGLFSGNTHGIEIVIMPIRMNAQKAKDLFPRYTTLFAKNTTAA